MASLKITRLDGTSETRELSRSQPLTIGRQSFNDICVPENDVAPFHCRISWNKKSFEVTAATSDGVEVNSRLVANIDLKSGDLVRIGSLDLMFQDEPSAGKPARAPGSETQSPRKSPLKAESPAKPDATVKPVKQVEKVEQIEKPVEELALYSGEIMTESQAAIEQMFAQVEADAEKQAPAEDASYVESRPGEILQLRKLRPGEQDVFKSPLVLALSFGGIVLLLVTGIFWFLLVHEHSNKQYDRANAEMNEGQYAQSVASFEKFIAQYPRHSLRKQADRGLAKASILKEISGAAPAWKRGLERLNDLIKAHRNESDFADLHSTLAQFAEQIAIGSAKSAEQSRDAELLVISKEAQVLLERYADPAAPPVSALGRISEQRVKAETAIAKQKTFDVAIQAVEAAIAQRKPLQAMSQRERLIKRFPEFLNSARVRESLQKALDLEQSVIAVDGAELPAQTTDDPPAVSESTLGILLTRSRTDDVSQSRVVFAQAKDSCYAVDAVTGELIWRRVVGSDPPFFPVISNGAQPSVLLFDLRKLELVCCQLNTGKLIWRQPLRGRAIGAPLIHEGQIYQAVEGNQLIRIDVDSGRITARAIFSQDLATTPALSRDGEYLLAPGQMAMIYSLAVRTSKNRQPLAAVATTFTDHAAGSISAPPLSMGRLLLLCENDRVDSANLRIWDASNPAISLKELAATRTLGHVRDQPVLRGNQLVVPLSGEQFDAFAVTDEPERAGIAPIGQYRADRGKEQVESPLFVALGADGQFWSAGSAFRKFEMAGGSIKMDSKSTAPGIASQPLQMAGDYFFVGRKARYSDAVTFSTIERESLTAPWRCILGDQPLELIPTREGGVAWIGESGSLYSMSRNRLLQGGVDTKAGSDLELPLNVSKPIRASLLHDQRMIVAVAGESTQLFLLNNSGQVVSRNPLDLLPEADPVLLDEGLVLPLPGRLKVLPLSSGKKPVMDWTAPVGDGVGVSWAHLVRIDGRELIAIDRTGRLTRIQMREGDVPHLAEVAKVQFDHPVDLRPVLQEDSLYVADASGVCRQLNIHSFDTDAEHQLTAPIRNLWSASSKVVVHAGDRRLYCLSQGKDLPAQWTFDMGTLDPVGPVIVKGDAIWMACRNGTVLVLNFETGAELRRLELPQTLSLGLREINDLLIAVASDGAMYRLE